ncbi:MAG: beta-galactosidase [Armatimonadota bacterium]
MWRYPVLAVLLLACLSAAHGQIVEIPALNMADKAKWTEWSGSTAHVWDIVPDGHGGKPALRILARNSNDDVMVMTETEKLQAGKRYAVTIWWRLEGLSPEAQVDFRTIFRDKDGKWLSGDDQHARSTTEQDGWLKRQYRITPPPGTVSSTLGIWVRETTGTIRVSDVTIEEMPEQQRTFDSMYDYDPEQVPLGMAPLDGFNALRTAKSPFLPRAMRWNEMMIRTGFLQEDLARAHRAAGYTGKAGRLTTCDQTVKAILKDLDALQQTYGRLFDAKQAGELPARFDAVADKLEPRIAEASTQMQSLIKSLCPALTDASWTRLSQPNRNQPWWDAQKRRPRYMLWSRWSTPEFWEMEKPLDMGEGHTLTSGAPAKFENGVADWSNYLAEWDRKRSFGAKTSSLITHYSLHDRGYLAPEFAKQHGDDPDLRMWDKEGKPLGAPAGVTNFNWLNPLARAHMVDVLTQMATFFKPRAEFQYYVSSWESAGPRAGGVRIGQNPSHLTDFRAYLQKRYNTIAELNRRWGSNYASFEEISPAPEQTLAAGQAATPLQIESQRWAHEAYVDYISLITKTVRETDPQKPVLGEQSGIPRLMFSPRLMDSVDIIGHHNRAGTTMPVQLWISSLQRYHGTPSALFENFWGCQEDHPARLMDERAMRAQMRRYLYRHAAWGRSAQVWWYAYTSAPYLLTYNGNWFTPVYDLTTMRYSAAGFPVEKAKVDRVETALLGSEIVPSKVLLVQPYATMLAEGEANNTVREWLGWHNLLYPRNMLYEVLPDEYFTSGRAKLSGFDVVILPLATHLDEAFTKQLVEFAQAGGTVICSGPAALYNELGRPNGQLLSAAKLQARLENPEGDWRYPYGKDEDKPWVEASVGKGKVVALTQSVTRVSDAEDAAGLVGMVRQKAAPAAEAPATTLELLLRRLPDGRHLLCVLNRDPDKATSGEVSVQGNFKRVADIDMPTPCSVKAVSANGRTRFNVSLEAGATTYIMLAP